MDEYEEYMIPHIPMNDENKVEEEYGVIFRMGEDRLRRQVLSKSWFFGYIIDHFKGDDNQMWFLVDWWYNFKLPTKEHEFYYKPSAIPRSDPFTSTSTFRRFVHEYRARRRRQKKGKLPPPTRLKRERQASLKGRRSHLWEPGVPGYGEYQIYRNNIKHSTNPATK